MKPKICLSIEDGYADVYALHTLYAYLMENNFDAEFKVYCGNVDHVLRFNRCIRESGIDDCFKSDRVMFVDERERWPDIILGGHSDANYNLTAFPERTILIDHSILKNCVKPTTKEKKTELRKQYCVPEDKPVVVIGFPMFALGCDKNLEKVINNICNDSSVYLVGSVRFQDFDRDKVHSFAKIVDVNGVLKDYYAMADVAMMHRNIAPSDFPYYLHNFVEATAGGPVFLVEPKNKLQYGYKQLVRREVIREAKDTEDLIAKLKKYLQNPQEDLVRAQRTQHLEHSRNLYLPDILRLINRALGKSQESFESDLLAEILPPKIPYLTRKYSPRITVKHPETIWDLSRATDNPKSISQIPKKVYKAFGRGR